MKLRIVVVLVIAAIGLASGRYEAGAESRSHAVVGGACDGCELMYDGMPADLSWETVIADSSEAGEPLVMSGTIFLRDGETPARSVVLYVYHADARGLYAPAPDQKHARRHGHLRGWMRTGEDGHYRFKTIRPAPYPRGRIPAHIHPIVKEPDKNEYWIDEYVFAGDELLTDAEKGRYEARGGSGIVTLTKNADGVWIGSRDIVLGLNVPDYPAK